MKLSTDIRNGRLDVIETLTGPAPTMRLFTGAEPANTAAADSGTVLATLALPDDWMQAAAGASKAMSGTWRDAEADGTGTAGHFRVYSSGGQCKIQGPVSLEGGGGDMQLDNVSLRAGQEFTVAQFTIIDPNG